MDDLRALESRLNTKIPTNVEMPGKNLSDVLTESTSKLNQRVNEAAALRMSPPKPPAPPPPPEDLPKATAEYTNKEPGWFGKLWKKLFTGSAQVWTARGSLAFDVVTTYEAISSHSTFYEQAKETSFWGGRLMGGAMGAKYGLAVGGPWGMLIGGVLGAIFGESAVRSGFAVVEGALSSLASPINDAAEAWKDPEVRRYVNEAADSFTGMDKFNSGLDQMYEEVGRQSRERR